MQISKELIEQAKVCKSAEEISALAKENGIELTEKDSAEIFAYLHKNGELADDELIGAAGGGSLCGNITYRYNIGDKVSIKEFESGGFLWEVKKHKCTGEITGHSFSNIGSSQAYYDVKILTDSCSGDDSCVGKTKSFSQGELTLI